MGQLPEAAPARLSTKPRTSRSAWRANITGYLLISPWLCGFLALFIGPSLASMALTFTQYNVMRPPVFIGLANYREAFTSDPLFYSSLGRSFYYSLMDVPFGVVGSLLLAILLNSRVKGTTVFRTLFYVPSLVPVIAASVMFIMLLHPDWGPVNAAIRRLGVQPPGWFGERRWAVPSLVLMSWWLSVGGARMIIFLAGLQGIPQEMYEAASIDGASSWQRMLRITIPLLTPTIFLNTVLGVIGSLQAFTSAFVTTQGGPGFATWFFSLHIYNQAFEFLNMGYAATLAWLFALIIVSLTLMQQRLSKQWVFYYGG
jgi:multiple sugar transport system permease protein